MYVCNSEFDILKQLGAERELGLEPQLLPHIVHTLCEELLLGGCATGSLLANVDDSILASLMAEFSDPALQRTVVRLTLAAARADGHVADSETLVLEAARHHWRLAAGGWQMATRPASRHRFAIRRPDLLSWRMRLLTVSWCSRVEADAPVRKRLGTCRGDDL